MGWTDSHLHNFEIVNPATGTREEIGVEELLNWVGGIFDPEYFGVDDVDFDNPKKQLDHALFD